MIAASSARARWSWRALALVALFACTALRVHAIHTTYMREDEEIAYRTTARDLGFAVYYQAEHDVHAPLWFVTFWLWQQAAGSGEFAGRLYSILLAALVLALTYHTARRWFGAERYGWAALLALGVNSYAFIYALEIRPYALVMLAALGNMHLFRRWLVRQTWRAALWYGASAALMLWLHYFLAFLLMAQAAYFAVWSLVRPQPRRVWMQGAAAAACALALWSPWLPVFVGQVAALRDVETASGAFRGLGIGSTTEPTTPAAIAGLIRVATNGQPLLYAALAAVGVVWLVARPRPTLDRRTTRADYLLVMAWVVLVPAFNLLVNLIASVYTQRYLAYVSVGVALAAGAGLAALPVGRLARFALVIVFAALNLATLASQLPFHTPHRLVLQAVSRLAQPGDVVYFLAADENDRHVRWQINAYLDPALTRVDDLDAARAASRVWFVTADLFDEAVQTAFRRIEADHPLQTVVGNCDRTWCYIAQLLAEPPLADRPAQFGDLDFLGAFVDAADSGVLDVRLWWRAAEPLTRDYSTSLQLVDAAGALVAQEDSGTIADLPTSALVPATRYGEAHQLVPAAPLAPGSYTLYLIVYQSWDGVRLLLPDGTDRLALLTFDVAARR